MDTDERCFDCSTCRYRYSHFLGMDAFDLHAEMSMYR